MVPCDGGGDLTSTKRSPNSFLLPDFGKPTKLSHLVAMYFEKSQFQIPYGGILLREEIFVNNNFSLRRNIYDF